MPALRNFKPFFVNSNLSIGNIRCTDADGLLRDAAGNTGSRTLFVDVTDKLDPILLDEDLSEVYASQMTVGEVLRVREIGASGGSGKLSVVKSVMSEGIVREIGTHESLLAKGGDYAHLCKLQQI